MGLCLFSLGGCLCCCGPGKWCVAGHPGHISYREGDKINNYSITEINSIFPSSYIWWGNSRGWGARKGRDGEIGCILFANSDSRALRDPVKQKPESLWLVRVTRSVGTGYCQLMSSRGSVCIWDHSLLDSELRISRLHAVIEGTSNVRNWLKLSRYRQARQCLCEQMLRTRFYCKTLCLLTGDIKATYKS